jgi:hypothetical protein
MIGCKAVEMSLQRDSIPCRHGDGLITAVYEKAVRGAFYEIYPRGDGDDKQHNSRRCNAFDRTFKRALVDKYLVPCGDETNPMYYLAADAWADSENGQTP